MPRVHECEPVISRLPLPFPLREALCEISHPHAVKAGIKPLSPAQQIDQLIVLVDHRLQLGRFVVHVRVHRHVTHAIAVAARRLNRVDEIHTRRAAIRQRFQAVELIPHRRGVDGRVFLVESRVEHRRGDLE